MAPNPPTMLCISRRKRDTYPEVKRLRSKAFQGQLKASQCQRLERFSRTFVSAVSAQCVAASSKQTSANVCSPSVM